MTPTEVGKIIEKIGESQLWFFTVCIFALQTTIKNALK